MRFGVLVSGVALAVAAGCTSPLNPLANGYNAVLADSQGLLPSGESLPTSGSATWEGYLLLSAYEDTKDVADFIGAATLEGRFTGEGARVEGSATGFVDHATEELVEGTVELRYGVIDRAASVAWTELGARSFLINADGDLTTVAGETYAFDTRIEGHATGPEAQFLTGEVEGSAQLGPRYLDVGGTLLSERVE